MNDIIIDWAKSTITFNFKKVHELACSNGVLSSIIFILTNFYNCLIRYEFEQYLIFNNYTIPNTSLKRLVPNGYYKKRTICVLLGLVLEISVPRMLDRLQNTVDAITNPIKEYKSIYYEKYQHATEYIINYALYIYLLGVSQVKVSQVMDILYCQHVVGFKKSTISLKKDKWVNDYNKFLHQDLSNINNGILIVDGTYFSAKGSEKSICVLSAVEITASGYRVIGWRGCSSESEKEWTDFFQHLCCVQGMGQPRMVICDGGTGALAAIKNLFPKANIQRCWVHKIRNILSLVDRKEYKTVTQLLRKIYKSKDREQAMKNMDIFLEHYKKNKKVVNCITEDIDYLFTFFELDPEDYYRSYTTNIIENIFSVAKFRSIRAKGGASKRTISFFTFKIIEHLTYPHEFGCK